MAHRAGRAGEPGRSAKEAQAAVTRSEPEGAMELSDRFGGLGPRSTILIVLTIGAGLLHHVDHVLRVDHSGWPFRPDVNPFTFSLLAYPILLFALFGPRRWFWVRWGLLLVGAAFTLFAHTALETPEMQYTMWAHDHSSDPRDVGSHNLLGLQSSAVGAAAVVLSMTLNVLLIASCLAMLWDGLKARHRPVGA